MGDPRPPHPGAQPSALTFPFVEAEQAAAEARTLAGNVQHLRTSADDGLDDVARGQFAGRFADWLLGRGGDLYEQLQVVEDDLRDQAEAIEALILRARGEVERRFDEIAEWEVRYQRWHAWSDQ